MLNLWYENEFDLYENELLCGTQFYMNAFARRLVLTDAQSQLRNGLLKRVIKQTLFCGKDENIFQDAQKAHQFCRHCWENLAKYQDTFFYMIFFYCNLLCKEKVAPD